MYSATEIEEIKAWILNLLLTSERFYKQDIFNRYPEDRPDVARAIWLSTEFVRKTHGIDFGPVAGHPDMLARKDPDEIAARSRAGRLAALRKLARAQERIELSAKRTEDPAAKQKRERESERELLRLALATSRKTA